MRTMKYNEKRENLNSFFTSSFTSKEEPPTNKVGRITVKPSSELLANETTNSSKDRSENRSNNMSANASNNSVYEEVFNNWLMMFLLERLHRGITGVAYIYGPPGIGKSTAVNKIVMHEPVIIRQFRLLKINCGELGKPSRLFKTMCEKLKIKTSRAFYLGALEQHLSTKPKPILLILYNIEALGERKSELLYHLFTLGGPKASIAIVGMGTSPLLTPELEQRLPLETQFGIISIEYKPHREKYNLNLLNAEFAEESCSKHPH